MFFVVKNAFVDEKVQINEKLFVWTFKYMNYYFTYDKLHLH